MADSPIHQPKPLPEARPVPPSGIRDNHNRGAVGEYLRATIQPGSKLSIVSAYFTIYAYEALKPELEAVSELRFLFGEPRSVKSLDPAQRCRNAALRGRYRRN